MDKKWRSGQSNGSRSYQKSDYRERPVGPPDPSEAAENLAEYVIKALAHNHESVQITRESSDPAYIRVNVSCDPNITGRLIGKGGKTISALRMLVRAAAQPRNKRVDVEILSSDTSMQT